jgi:hypothetical protein
LYQFIFLRCDAPELESASDNGSDAKSIEAQFEQMFDRVKGVRAQAVRACVFCGTLKNLHQQTR